MKDVLKFAIAFAVIKTVADLVIDYFKTKNKIDC